ncbi:hypothetical protein ACOMCU_01210 [Lysinibacillus sp. UGB7]|uniref:hypothetical protein n=1 Tax=Lysinibacillus sp. UGB7 TaxID=3411039 RepID=UPI003B7F63DF
MQTLDAPLYEVDQESIFYKHSLEKRDYHEKLSMVIGEIAEAYGFNGNDFRYYGPYKFGFLGSSDAYDLTQEHLVKNEDRNGVYAFRKSSKPYKDISARLLSVPEINFNPFEVHDVFGSNNLIASQWVGDRLFYGVKDASQTEDVVAKRAASAKEHGKTYVEPVVKIDHKDYLKLIIAALEEKEEEKSAVAS